MLSETRATIGLSASAETGIPIRFACRLSRELGAANAIGSIPVADEKGRAMNVRRFEPRTALVVAAVRSGIAVEQDEFTVSELRLAAHLHRQAGELLSAEQYEDIAEAKEE